jgi:hypothetical protein
MAQMLKPLSVLTLNAALKRRSSTEAFESVELSSNSGFLLVRFARASE